MTRRQSSPQASDMKNVAISGSELQVNIVNLTTQRDFPQVHVSKTCLTHLTRSHRYVLFARPDQKFGIDVITYATFDWGEANALEVTITFDVGKTVNEKSVFLMRPRQERRRSNLVHSNALLEMTQRGSDFNCCIDRVLIQDPTTYTGIVNAYGFVFADVSRGTATKSSTTKPGGSPDKVSEHQGKIRVEVARRSITAGMQRFPGLDHKDTDDVRASTQTLLDQGLRLEVELEKDVKAGVLEYGHAFRTVMCKPTAQPRNFTFEFLYRDAALFDAIVTPSFQPEIADSVSLLTIRHGPKDGPNITAADTTQLARETTPVGTQTRSSPPTFHKSDSFSSSTDLTQPSSMATTPAASPHNHVDIADTWRKAQEVWKRCAEQDEVDQKAERALEEQLASEQKAKNIKLAGLQAQRLKLDVDEANTCERYNKRKRDVEVELAQIKKRRATRAERISRATNMFEMSLHKTPEECTPSI